MWSSIALFYNFLTYDFRDSKNKHYYRYTFQGFERAVVTSTQFELVGRLEELNGINFIPIADCCLWFLLVVLNRKLKFQFPILPKNFFMEKVL